MTSQERKDKNRATVTILFFLFYPTIVTAIASSINCVDIEGTSRLYDDLEQVCYTGLHLKVVHFISIPGFILWVFGIPLYALYLLRKW